MSARSLEALLGLPGLRELRPGEWAAAVAPAQLTAAADAAVIAGLRLATLFASEDADGGFRIHHVWAAPAHRAFVRVSAPVEGGAFPSLTARLPAANWMEREVMDLFGLVPAGHPNPHRVALHEDWPDGEWALRRSFPADRIVPRVVGEFHPFRPVTGEGVFQVPVGPVHAGIIEPGHFRFGVAGEPVLYLQLRLFYVHKGIEKRFLSLPWRHGVFLAESISGDTAVGHALAHCHALEALLGVEVPARARYLRSVLLELERIYNHVADIGALATDVAFAVPASRAQVLREGLVALHERVFGTRLLRGTITPGGVKSDITVRTRRDVAAHAARLQGEFEELVTLLVDSGGFTDRVDQTGILTAEAARDLGVVGLAARASGLDMDLRRDHPHDASAELPFEAAIEEGGDVRARFMVRAREVEQSLGIVIRALEALPEGPLRVDLPADLPASASALGGAEGWRGECLHWMETDEAGRLTRVKVCDPSTRNWPALAHVVPGNIIPDFPVINKSFNLSYSGNDR